MSEVSENDPVFVGLEKKDYPPHPYSIEEFLNGEVTEEKNKVYSAMRTHIDECLNEAIWGHKKKKNFLAKCPDKYQHLWDDPKNWNGWHKIGSVTRAWMKDNQPEWMDVYRGLRDDIEEQKKLNALKLRYKDNYPIRNSVDEKGELSDDDYQKWLELFKGFAAETYFPIAEEGQRQSNMWNYKTFPADHESLKEKYGGDKYIRSWLERGNFGHDQHEYQFWQAHLGEMFFDLSVKRGLHLEQMDPLYQNIKKCSQRFQQGQNTLSVVLYKKEDRNIQNIHKVFIGQDWDEYGDALRLEISIKFPRANVVSRGDWDGGEWGKILDGTHPLLKKHDVIYCSKHTNFKILQPVIGGKKLGWETFYEANKPFGEIQTDGYNTWILYPPTDNINAPRTRDKVVECICTDPNMGRAGERLVRIRKNYHDLGLLRDWQLCESEYKDITNKIYKKVSENTKNRSRILEERLNPKRRKTSNVY